MKLVHGAAIKLAMREIAPTIIATAYVGIDWANYIDKTTLKSIVLSPTVGSNPYAILKIAHHLGWENVHFLDNLHAKIYLGAVQAAVGSFNLTSNGLSAEGLEEAGFVVSDSTVVTELRNLVNGYIARAKLAYPKTADKIVRLSELRAIWDRAVKSGTIRNDSCAINILDYRPIEDSEVYVCCVWGKIRYNEDVIHPTMINDSVAFLEADEISPDRWVLCWRARNDGYPDNSYNPYWLHIDEIIVGGATHVQYTKVAVQRNDRQPLHEPFELNAETIRALRAVLSSNRFPEFLGNIDPWSVNPTLPRLSAFFEAVRTQLQSRPDEARLAEADFSEALLSSAASPLRTLFKSRIEEAMDIAVRKKYVKPAILGMLHSGHAVEVAKNLVRGEHLKSGLKKLARAKALKLSFESIMLETKFKPLFTREDLQIAAWNLLEVDPHYSPPQA